MNTIDEKLTLETLAEGAAVERFDDALKTVLANILDPDTGTGAREVNLKVKLRPNDDRSMTEIKIECTTKLQPASSITTHAMVDLDGTGAPEAHEIRPKQQAQLPFTSTVVLMKKKEAIND